MTSERAFRSGAGPGVERQTDCNLVLPAVEGQRVERGRRLHEEGREPPGSRSFREEPARVLVEGELALRRVDVDRRCAWPLRREAMGPGDVRQRGREPAGSRGGL